MSEFNWATDQLQSIIDNDPSEAPYHATQAIIAEAETVQEAAEKLEQYVQDHMSFPDKSDAVFDMRDLGDVDWEQLARNMDENDSLIEEEEKE